MTPPLSRRSYLAAVLASATAGCSLWGGDEVSSETPVSPAVEGLVAGHVVAVGQDLETTTVATDGTETPVQDALDAIAETGGRVYLPPRRVTERGSVRPYRNTGLYGFGMNVSVLHITEPEVDGIVFDRQPRASRVQLDGFELRGPSPDTASGAAIHFLDSGATQVADPADFYVGRLYFWAWNNSVYRVDEGVGPFQCRHDFLRMDDCDAGDENALVEWHAAYGPANQFGTIVAYPTASWSGQNSDLLYHRGGELGVGDITVGGTAGRLVDTRYGRLGVGRLHYEPEGQRSVPGALVRVGSGGATRVDDVVVDSGAVEYVYELRSGAGNAVLGGPPGGNGTVRDSVVTVSGRLDSDRRSFYFGRPADVDVNVDADTGSLRVLGAAGVGMG